jgi:Na+/H+ antiporter NhaD/arsenite permease-like protein
MLKGMLPNFGLPPEGANCLYWALAFGVCIGGNGSLVGASANVIVCKIANKAGYPISFLRFMAWGFPLMCLQMLCCMLYLWVRYFVMK